MKEIADAYNKQKILLEINQFNYEHDLLLVRQLSCIEFTSFYCSDIPMVQSINCNSYIKTLEKHLCVTVTVQYQILHLQTKWVITHKCSNL